MSPLESLKMFIYFFVDGYTWLYREVGGRFGISLSSLYGKFTYKSHRVQSSPLAQTSLNERELPKDTGVLCTAPVPFSEGCQSELPTGLCCMQICEPGLSFGFSILSAKMAQPAVSSAAAY